MFDGPEPIYQQIAQMIRAQVLSGELAEEDQVMSTTQFATTFRINPATAQKAFGQLVDEQVLYKRRGLGMFVAPGAYDRLRGTHRERFFDEVLAPALAQADLLGIEMDDVVGYIRGRSTTDGPEHPPTAHESSAGTAPTTPPATTSSATSPSPTTPPATTPPTSPVPQEDP